MDKTSQRMFSAKEIAEKCGICKATIYNMVKRGEIPPPKKFGRSSRWDIRHFTQSMPCDHEKH